MIKKSFKITALALASLMVTSISAQAREFADIYTECGLGAIIAPNTPAVAAVTNVTWDLGTTAISSNISSPDTCAGGKEKTAAFIYKSYDNLEKEIAMGTGKYLNTLISLTGINISQKDKFISEIRKDFAKLVSSKEYLNSSRYEKSKVLYNIVYSYIDS